MSQVDVTRRVIIPHKPAHSTSINTILFVPSEEPDDNPFVATGASDDTIRIWDQQGNEINIFIGHLAPVTQIDFSFFEDKLIMASGSEDGTAKLWDYESGEVIKNFSDASHTVKAVKIKHDKLITGSKDKHFRIYDIATGNLLTDLEVGGVTAIATHPTKDYCVIGTTTNHLMTIDVDTGEIKRKILAHELPIQGLDFSTDGKLLVSVSLNKQVKVWNAQTELTELIAFNAHTSPVSSVKFRPHKDSFATCGFDRLTHLFQPGNIKPVKRFKGPKLAATELCWNKSGTKLAIASADGSFRIFDLANENEPILLVEATKEYISHILIDKKNNNLIAGFGDGSIKFYSMDKLAVSPFEPEHVLPEAHKGIVTWLGITPNQRLLSASEEKYLKLWDLESYTLFKATDNETSHTLGINDLIVHPTENWCISVSADSKIKKWLLPDLTLDESFATHKYAVNSVNFSTDFQYIVTTSNDKRVVLHDKDMKDLFTYKGHTDSVLASVFSVENKFLFTGAKNGKIIIFDVQKEKEVNSLTLHTDAILKFKFSDDYKYLAIISADNHCSIFSYKTTENAFELKNIYLASFSGNPTDIIWIDHENESYSLLITTYIGELIELTFKNEEIGNEA